MEADKMEVQQWAECGERMAGLSKVRSKERMEKLHIICLAHYTS